jgi:trimethylamine--corrinoid protein Co-methyltransferase
MMAAGAQLAREKYKVPVSLHGPWTDSIIPDGQSDLERMHFTLIPGLAGANVFSGAGMIEQGKTFSFEQLVIDDDIHGMVKLALGGINTDESHLAVESIGRVGPGGNFLVDDLTLKYLREERFFPMLMVRSSRQVWETKGAKNLRERAKDKARQIISQHRPSPLDQDISKEISALISAAEKSLAQG